eukprot:343405-Rhodomonas_salina.2
MSFFASTCLGLGCGKEDGRDAVGGGGGARGREGEARVRGRTGGESVLDGGLGFQFAVDA